VQRISLYYFRIRMIFTRYRPSLGFPIPFWKVIRRFENLYFLYFTRFALREISFCLKIRLFSDKKFGVVCGRLTSGVFVHAMTLIYRGCFFSFLFFYALASRPCVNKLDIFHYCRFGFLSLFTMRRILAHHPAINGYRVPALGSDSSPWSPCDASLRITLR
jgi:hypothetical protein